MATYYLITLFARLPLPLSFAFVLLRAPVFSRPLTLQLQRVQLLLQLPDFFVQGGVHALGGLYATPPDTALLQERRVVRPSGLVRCALPLADAPPFNPRLRSCDGGLVTVFAEDNCRRRY
jgi:hypothetical protein